MKTGSTLFFTFYFLLGSMLLPLGNFEAMKDLPAMYTHCQQTEDKDLTPLDFVIEHLLGWSDIFEEEYADDGEKPHKPIDNNYSQQAFQFAEKMEVKSMKKPIVVSTVPCFSIYTSPSIDSDYIFALFRPPITA